MPTFLVPADDPLLALPCPVGLEMRVVTPRRPTPADRANMPWLASDAAFLMPYLAIPGFRGGRLLLLDSTPQLVREALAAVFATCLVPAADTWLAGPEELLRILAADTATDRAIALSALPGSGLVIWRGDLSRSFVPNASFPVTPDGSAPDFAAPYASDGGTMIILGAYEVASATLLHGAGSAGDGDR